jgi:uncharacterized protein
MHDVNLPGSTVPTATERQCYSVSRARRNSRATGGAYIEAIAALTCEPARGSATIPLPVSNVASAVHPIKRIRALVFAAILGLPAVASAQTEDAAVLKRGLDAIATGDYAVALAIFKPMADQGNAFAQFTIGQLAESGSGMPKNPREAARWYKLAADAGQTDAMTNLGFMYEQGRGVPQDYVEAVRLYKVAAEAGNPVAQTNLGTSYVEGKIVKQDDAQAAAWFRKAAAQGDPQAQFNLARMYDSGRGVAKDPEEAFKLYRDAANIGLPAAQLNLGVAYAEGKGVPKDPVEAHRWFNLAAGNAEDDGTRSHAERNRDLIAKLMTPEEVMKAQALAREWKPAASAAGAQKEGASNADRAPARSAK